MNLVGRNMLWLLLAQVATWAMSLLMILVVPQFLGAEGFGEYAFAGAYVGFFQLAGGLGTSILLTREIARDYSIVGRYVINGLVLKLVLGIALSALAMAGGVLWGFDAETLVLVGVCCVGMMTILLNEVLAGALAGMQRMGKTSAWMVVSVYVSAILGILVLANGGGVVAYATALTVAATIPLVANAWILWPIVRGERHLDLGVWKVLVRGGLPLMLLAVFNQIYGTIDIPILAAIAGTTTVGWYSLAYRWAGIPIFVATAVVNSHYPQLAQLGKTGDPEFAPLVNRAIKLILLGSVPAAIGLAVVAPELFEVLYDPEFSGSVRPLQILALQLPITALDTLLATALIASDRLRNYLVVAGAAAAINPILTGVLVTVTMNAYDNGAIGAAIATALTEVFVMGCAFALSARGVMDGPTLSWSLRCVLAGLSIGLVAVFAGGAHLAVQVGLGMLLYLVSSLVLGTVTVETLRQGAATVVEMVRSRRQRSPETIE